MKNIFSLLALLCLEKALHAQYIYTIKADSVKVTNSCDTAELIIENHTQNVPGFLFNKGRGRTEFRRPLQWVNDNLYLIGADSLKLNAWMQGGNFWGTTGIFGTKDNNHIDLYTNNAFRGRWTNTGNLLIGTNIDENFKFKVSGGPAMFSDRLFVNVFNANDTGQLFFKTEAGTYSSYIGTRGYDMIYRVRSANDSYRFAFGNILTSLAFTGNGAGNILVMSPNNHITLGNVNTIFVWS